MPSRNLYSTTNAGAGLPAVANLSTIVATRNTDNFLYGYDLSGISIYNAGAGTYTAVPLTYGQQFAWLSRAILISNRHFICAYHTMASGIQKIAAGGTFDIAFVNNNNQTFVYTCNQLIDVTGDVLVGVLTTTVDSSLKIYKIFPANFFDLYCKYALEKQYNPLIVVYFLRYLQNNVQNPNYIDNTAVGDSVYFNQAVNIYGSYVESRRILGLTVFPGDSGHPIFTIFNNELVFLGLFYSGGQSTQVVPTAGMDCGVAPWVSYYTSKVNNAMATSVGNNYYLNQINITDFYNYNFNQIPTLTKNDIYGGYNRRPIVEGRAYPVSTLTIFDSGVSSGTTTALSSGNFSYTPVSDLSYGTHNFTATSVASGSAASEASIPFTIDIKVFPSPVINTSGDTYNPYIPIQGTSVDIPTTVTITIYDGVSSIGTTVVTTGGNWSFTPVTLLSSGVHSITAVASFIVTTTSTTVTSNSSNPSVITVLLPNPPTLNFTSPTNDTTPTVTGTAIYPAQILVYIDDVFVQPAVNSDSNGNFSWTPNSALSVATHTIKARQRYYDNSVSPIKSGEFSNYSTPQTLQITL